MQTERAEYLTEAGVQSIIESFSSVKTVDCQYRLVNKKIVDYRISMDAGIYNTIYVEFDGYRHYSQQKTIERDIEVQELLIQDLKSRIVHIPYWVQDHFVRSFFFHDLLTDAHDANHNYPNGFIDAKCLKPIDFNYNGWIRFVYELSHFPTRIQKDVKSTMSQKELSIYDSFIGLNQNVVYRDLDWFRGCLF